MQGPTCHLSESLLFRLALPVQVAATFPEYWIKCIANAVTVKADLMSYTDLTALVYPSNQSDQCCGPLNT